MILLHAISIRHIKEHCDINRELILIYIRLKRRTALVFERTSIH